MTVGEVCLNGAKIGGNQVAMASRRPEPRFFERKNSSWFQNEARSATIGAEFGSYLGNVGYKSALVTDSAGSGLVGGRQSADPVRGLVRSGPLPREMTR
jgi:hypothetical protein